MWQSTENHRRPDYMGGQALRSPEALLGAHCGTNTDMWALGCVVGMHFRTNGTTLTDYPVSTIAFRTNHWRRSI